MFRCENIHEAHINRLTNEKFWYCKDYKPKRKAESDNLENSPQLRKAHIEEESNMSRKMDKLFELMNNSQQTQNGEQVNK